MLKNSREIKRCAWVTEDPIYIDYHDNEWGRPIYDDHLLFEFLILEGAQAGLSWLTILKRRENYRKAFANFDPKIIALYKQPKIEKILLNPGIIRNRLKVESTVINAKAYLNLIDSGESFSDYIWNFVDGKQINNHIKTIKDIPSENDISKKMSKELKKLGFKFIGGTICYAFMQAVGLVNDHTKDCFCFSNIKEK